MEDYSWLVDLPKSKSPPRIKTNGDSSKNDVIRARWNTEEVMYYYGKWIENEETASILMKIVEMETKEFYKLAFTHRMNIVRGYLIYECGTKNIPFIPSYRRLENDYQND